MPHETEALISQLRDILNNASEDEVSARKLRFCDLRQRIQALLYNGPHDDAFVVKTWGIDRNADRAVG